MFASLSDTCRNIPIKFSRIERAEKFMFITREWVLVLDAPGVSEKLGEIELGMQEMYDGSEVEIALLRITFLASLAIPGVLGTVGLNPETLF